ncbi:thiamine ABC transporter substrate-binding protein [Leucobacter sp. W1478]|uniref:thiamine ABC transporter substrate-binding protein n=1 Tax=Leucobacter sp. W1478 TaxID=3439065 RepID=UPI003F3F40AF
MSGERKKSPPVKRRVAVRPLSLAVVAALGLAIAGCAGSEGDSGSADAERSVTLVVHESFPNEEFAAAASAATGYEVEVITAGDGGELTNKLILTQGAPIADAFFGVDNVFASRLVEGGVVEPYRSPALPPRAEEFVYDTEGSLSPVTLGATCINIDPAWFVEQGLAEPTGYDDLADPAYAGLTVLLDPTSSSTGASFLTGTVAAFGEDGFVDYWASLAENDVRIEQGWTEAYNGQFTQGGGEGTFPIVLSYSSSPAWTVTEDGDATTTRALLDTCSSQVEYAGVLSGAANPEGGRAVVDYLLSREFQDTIADTMYVYPVDVEAYVPDEWQRFAPMPETPYDLTPAEIGAGREAWLKAWSEATGW